VINTRKTTGTTVFAFIGIITLCILLTLSGCGKSEPEEEIKRYELSISVEGDGTTIPSPGKRSIVENTVVTLKAKPYTGSVFSHWGGPDGGSVTSGNTLVMDKDRAVTAVFVKLEYDLMITVTPSGAGTVTEELVTDRKYEHGQVVHLTPVPAADHAGYAFDHWAGANAADVTSENNILMNGGKALEVVFAQYSLGIEIQPVDGVAGQLVSGAGPPDYPTVKVATTGGTPVPGIAVTVTEKNGGPISGTLTQTTDAGGLAVFDDLSFSEEGMYCLVFAPAGIASVQTNQFSISLAGSGSTENPYQIHNIYGLYLISSTMNATYRLENDIDASATGIPGTLYWNEGKGWQPLNGFRGTIEGDNHKIRNLYINRPDETNVGLFKNESDFGILKINNLHLVDVNITGMAAVGALVGKSRSGLEMNNCSVSGAVTGIGEYVGGLCGDTRFAYFNDCSSSATVTGYSVVGGLAGQIDFTNISRCFASGDVGADDIFAGGLIGLAETNCTVDNCYARCNVSGLRILGGFVGYIQTNDVVVSQCYAVGTVTGDANRGGFLSGWATISNCFYDSTTSGLSDTFTGTTPKTTEELQDPDTYSSAWDRAIWEIVAGQYPTLKPQPQP